MRRCCDCVDEKSKLTYYSVNNYQTVGFGIVNMSTSGCGSEKLKIITDSRETFEHKFVRNEDGCCKFYKRKWWKLWREK